MKGLRKHKKLNRVQLFTFMQVRSYIVSYFIYARKTHVTDSATVEIHLQATCKANSFAKFSYYVALWRVDTRAGWHLGEF